jgi:hypothetical protein
MKTLVIAAFPGSLLGKRNGYERTAFLDHVDRKIHTRHARAHLFGDAMPSTVLDRVDDAEADVARRPANAASGANVRRKQLTPSTLLVVGGMSATITAWGRQQRQPGPASAADHVSLGVIERALAHDTRSRKEEICGE